MHNMQQNGLKRGRLGCTTEAILSQKMQLGGVLKAELAIMLQKLQSECPYGACFHK
ncbi:hypothetical protein J2T14_006094 [Paenibacillus harenae]|nr:hypothetical protein [Paenibacillus harenae]